MNFEKHAEWKKPDTEGRILFDSILGKCPESTGTENSGYQGLGGREGKESDC